MRRADLRRHHANSKHRNRSTDLHGYSLCSFSPSTPDARFRCGFIRRRVLKIRIASDQR